MAVRRESVEIRVDSNLASVATRDAAAVALLRRELDSVNGHPLFQANSRGQLVQINQQANSASQGLGGLQQQSTRTNSSLRETDRSINQLSGRLGLAVDAVFTLGSGLVPIGALAGQAAAGLAAMGAAAAVALGSGILAVQGVADAVKAVQKFQDDPSIENLRAANKELDSMAPAAARFVVEFQKARPLLSDIQESAARGWFPGLTAALGELDEVAPKLERILTTSGRMGGFLVKDGLKSLGGDRWNEFFKFVADEVPTAEASLARIMGDLAHGAAEMWMAFDPGNDSFIGWVEDVANSFDRWASSADGREGIEDFLAYARETGPQVAEFLSAVGGALLAIVRAAAPLGGPTLQALTAIAEAVERLAKSDFATPLLAGIAVMRLYSRAATIAAAATARFAGAQAASAATAGAMSAGSLAALVNAPAHLQGPLAAPRPGTTPAAASRFARFTPLLGSAATIAGVAVAAVAVNKAATANNELVDSLDAVQVAVDRLDFTGMASGLGEATSQLDSFKAKIEKGKGFGSLKDPGALLANTKSGIEGIFGDSDVEEGEKALAGLNRQAFISQHAVAGLGKAFGYTIGPLDGSVHSIHQLEKALASAKPAMDRLGVSQEDLVSAKEQQALISHGNLWGKFQYAVAGTATPFDDLVERLQRTDKWMDSAAARAQNYNAVLRDLANDQGTAADQADRFREAFEAMVSPANDAEAALSSQVDALQAIRKLNPKGGINARGGDNAQANAAATRDYTKAVEERIATMINAGRGEKAIANALRQSRRQFIESGVAAGFSADEMRKRANAIGLTPKLIRTTFKALGITEFDRKVEQLRGKLKGIPRRVQTDMNANGIPQTIAEVDDLVAKYDLTDKERTALISLVGAAQTKENALALSAVLDAAARDRQATITVVTNEIRRTRSDNEIGRHGGAADGTTVPKTGRPYADRHLYLLADGEEVISNRNGQADRHRSLLKAINAGRLADGGTTGGDTTTPMSAPQLKSAIRDNAAALKEFKASLKAATAALDKERQKREDFKAYRSEVAGSLGTELTGNGLAGLRAGLSANRSDARSALFALKKAKRNGLDGPLFDLIASSGDLNLIQQAAALSKSETARLERQYGASTSAQNALGNFASTEKFDSTLGGINKSIRTLNKTVSRLGKEVEKGAREGTRLGNASKSRNASTGTRAGR